MTQRPVEGRFSGKDTGFDLCPVTQKLSLRNNFKMKPDLGSGRSISYEAHFKHALIQMETGRKTADSPVLREKPLISPRNVSDGERTRPRI